MFKLQRKNLLQFLGSDSDHSSSLEDDYENLKENKYKQEAFVNNLEGYKVKSSIEKKLVLGILHRKGYKIYEEKIS